MKAKDLDKIFDDGQVDITDHLDLSAAFRPGQELKRVNVDFPTWMIFGSTPKPTASVFPASP